MPYPHEKKATNLASEGGLIATLTAAYRWRGTKWVVLALWLAVVAFASPLAAQLSDVEQNDTVEFLPESAESLRVYELQQQFPGDDTLPAVVIYHREGGLTGDDHEQAEADHQALSSRFPDLQLSPIIPSDDGNALMYVVPLSDQGDAWYDQAEEIRDLVSQSGSLEVKVTGPAGFTRDFVDVFDGIDSTLLIASASVVTVLLLLIYRSPFLWIVPLLVVGFGHQTSSAMIYGFVTKLGLTANSQNTGLLPILVFGVGTDYALLLIARYREELRRFEDKHEAMVNALRRAGPAILASGATTIIGLLCLLAADLNTTQGLGPIGAAGIFSAFVAMITLLPAVLLIFGRRVFWPFVPRYGSESGAPNGIWTTIGRFVSGRPRTIWAGTVVLLAALAFGFLGTDTHLSNEDAFRTEPESIAGQRLLAASFPAGAGAPTVVIAQSDAAEPVESAIRETPGVVDLRPDGESGDLIAFAVTINADPSTQAAFDIIDDLRDRVHAVPGANALVGGQDAMDLDVARANASDRMTVIPLVLGVVLVILVALLRALVAPLLMVGTSVLSFFAALGGSVLVFEHVFGFPALDNQVVLLSFVFLVTLGVDYNIFLMSRVREESALVGTREGTLRGLAVTGGVITSAGLVLAATFAVITVMPLVAMTQLGFIIAFGILIETMIVRSIVLPALNFDLDRWAWWPGRL